MCEPDNDKPAEMMNREEKAAFLKKHGMRENDINFILDLEEGIIQEDGELNAGTQGNTTINGESKPDDSS